MSRDGTMEEGRRHGTEEGKDKVRNSGDARDGNTTAPTEGEREREKERRHGYGVEEE